MESKWRANVPALQISQAGYKMYAHKLVPFTPFAGIAMQTNGVTRPMTVITNPDGAMVLLVGSPSTVSWTDLMALGWIEQD